MRIRPLTTGCVRGKRRLRGPRRYLPGGWSQSTLPVQAFAIEHPGGICLFDTGQTARAALPGYHPRWHPFLRLAQFELSRDDEAAAQIDPAAVRWVVLSHLHTDHVGGLPPFAAATVLVSRVEWRLAFGLAGRLRGYLPQHWPKELVPLLVDFDGPPVGPFSGSHDVTGDGSLLMVPLPGHTAGHAALLVEGRALLAGDAAHTPAELARVAPELSRWCRREGVAVLLAHDVGAGDLV